MQRRPHGTGVPSLGGIRQVRVARRPMSDSTRQPRIRDIYKGRIVHLTTEEITLPNGHRMELEIVRHPGASAVVPLTAEGEVLLIRQYRHAVGGFIYEVPAGKLDRKGESPEVCAAR